MLGPLRYPARALGLLATALAALAGGCGGGGGGGSDDPANAITGGALTLYSSLPRTGPSAPMARAVLAGQRRALADAHHRAGGYRIKLVQLDSAHGDGDAWDPSQVAKGAGRAAKDPRAIAYLGELDLGGSAVSLPLTSAAGIVQVSPGDGLTSLTRVPPSRPRAIPARLYPNGVRNFVRLVSDDLEQARTLASWARESGARRVWIVSDPGVYGDELAAQTIFAARHAGMTVLGEDRVPDPDSTVSLAQSIVAKRPGALIYTGDVEDGTSSLLDAITALDPQMPVFASSAVTQAARRVGPGVRGDLLGVKPAFPARHYPRTGRRVLRSLESAGGGKATARSEALYGYESVALVLDAINAAGSGRIDRARVRRRALAPRTRRSVLGTYELRLGGEASTPGFARYVIHRGALRPAGRGARR